MLLLLLTNATTTNCCYYYLLLLLITADTLTYYCYYHLLLTGAHAIRKARKETKRRCRGCIPHSRRRAERPRRRPLAQYLYIGTASIYRRRRAERARRRPWAECATLCVTDDTCGSGAPSAPLLITPMNTALHNNLVVAGTTKILTD